MPAQRRLRRGLDGMTDERQISTNSIVKESVIIVVINGKRTEIIS